MLLPAQGFQLITGDTFSTQILLRFGDGNTLSIDEFHLLIARLTFCTRPPLPFPPSLSHTTPEQSRSNPHEPLVPMVAKIPDNQSSPYVLRHHRESN